METLRRVICLGAVVWAALWCSAWPTRSLADDESRPDTASATLDRMLEEKVRRMYPEIPLQRGKPGEPFFSSVEAVARVPLEYLRDRGTGLVEQGLAVGAAEEACHVYVKQGRDAFLRRAPVRKHQRTSRGGNDSNRVVAQADDVDPLLLRKIRRLYPEVRSARDGNVPFFSAVKPVARLRVEDGAERLVVWVHVIIPAARTDHGRGELLIFRDGGDRLPLVRRGMHTLPVIHGSEIQVIENRWLRFGRHTALVSLADEQSLAYFNKHGLGLLTLGLSGSAVQEASNVYLERGLGAFLAKAPIREHRERHVKLPNRISGFAIYPSLAEDTRESGFKYSDAWEATVLVRLTPADEPQQPVVLEMGARGASAGIETSDVELLLWETRSREPADRPAP